MMSIIDRTYLNVPSFLQSSIVSARGFYLRGVRYTRKTWETLDRLQSTQWLSEGELRKLQLDELNRILESVLEDVPFYRRKYGKCGIAFRALETLDDLQKLPIIGKEEFRKENEAFFSERFRHDKLWAAYTSGTSGKPLKALYRHEDIQKRFAFLERLYQWYQPQRWRRRASFTGKLITHTGCQPKHVSRKNIAINQWLFSSHHLHEKNFDTYINDLQICRPEQIDGVLSPIYVVSRYINARGFQGRIQPAVVIPTSETLWLHIRSSIEEAFNCKVANQYGSQEGAPIAYECPAGGFHLCSESGIFEVLGPDDRPVKPGETGRLVVTSFLSEATPLVRYDIGDLAVLSRNECTCGRGLPCLEALLGRFDDMLYSSEMGIIPRVDSALKGVPNSIVFSQVAQTGPDRFELRLIIDDALYRPEHGDTVCHNLAKYIGQKSEVHIKILDDLPLGPGGKIKAMVNEYREGGTGLKIGEMWNQLNAMRKT